MHDNFFQKQLTIGLVWRNVVICQHISYRKMYFILFYRIPIFKMIIYCTDKCMI